MTIRPLLSVAASRFVACTFVAFFPLCLQTACRVMAAARLPAPRRLPGARLPARSYLYVGRLIGWLVR